jgi:CRP-like cAMP-binding protein
MLSREQSEEGAMNKDERAQLLSEVDLFQSLDTGTLEAVAEEAGEREYESGQVLSDEGDPVTEVWIIDGTVELSVAGNGGQREVVNTLGRADACGEAALYDEGDRMVSVRAVEETRILVIEGNRFRMLVGEHPAVAEALIRLLAGRLRKATTRR